MFYLLTNSVDIPFMHSWNLPPHQQPLWKQL